MTRACTQCRQVKGKCSLVKKRPAAPSTPPRAHKRPRVNEAGLSRTGGTQEQVEVADGRAETEDAWGVRACEEITWLSGSLEGLTAMIKCQTLILGRLAGMMEEEADWRRWRRRREGTPRAAPIMLGKGEEEEVREEVEEGVGNEGENEEDVE